MFDWFDRLFLGLVMYGVHTITTGWVSYALLFSAYIIFVFNAILVIAAGVFFYRNIQEQTKQKRLKPQTPDEMIQAFRKGGKK